MLIERRSILQAGFANTARDTQISQSNFSTYYSTATGKKKDVVKFSS
jgi:hypothetical protein